MKEKENKAIPFSAPDINPIDISAVTDVIKSGWLAHGLYSKKLEDLFCEYTGAKYATTVSNCTAGLHLSCMAAGFGPGDEVILPAQTHTATAHAIEYTGAKPIFADIDPLTGNIIPSKILRNITLNTKGIIPVHMAGEPCDMDQINNICKNNNLILIEDCAHALGSKINDIHLGNFGISGCFSFYPTKQITTGEGGIVISNDQNVIEFISKHRAFGIDTPPEMRSKPGFYDVKGLGYNYRMTDFQAALGAGQMERYSINLKTRKKNAELYSKFLSENKVVSFPKYNNDSSYFIFQILIKSPASRDKVLNHLTKLEIGCSVHYARPVPLLTYYSDKYGYKESDFPNASLYGKQVISLPSHQGLTQDDIAFIAEEINTATGI